MDEDEFEAMYADEMEALNDMEGSPPPPSRKTLFEADNKKDQNDNSKNSKLNDSLPTPLDDSDEVNKSPTNKGIKRKDSDRYQPMSDSEDEIDGILTLDKLPDINPKKRSKISMTPNQKVVTTTVDDDITPPPSRKVVTATLDDDITPPPSPPKHRISSEANNLFDKIKDRINNAYSGHGEFTRQRVWSRIPLGDFQSVTSGEGKRVYMNVKDESTLKLEEEELVNNCRGLDLLGTPYYQLLQQVDDERRMKAIEESQRISAALDRRVNADVDDDEDVGLADRPPQANLWVDRFAPRRYTELLSDESTNRTLLHWLKLWDHVVFGKVKKKKVVPKVIAKAPDGKAVWKPKDYRKEQREREEELDNQNRPFHKISLLYGPPGLGKTTLAYVIAKHAGYNVIEMNASDDRTVDNFRNKLESSIQMSSVLDASNRPNCLIIDEIDGAPQPAINLLINVVKGEGLARKRKEPTPLMRPIICICNDQYAPSLRLLRPHALLLQFPRTVSHRLASRLMDISREQRVKTDMTALLALCEKAENDIRSCINTLQFVHKKGKGLHVREVSGLTVGQKDAHKSLFAVWQEVFQLPKLQKRRYVNPNDRTAADMLPVGGMVQNNLSLPARFKNILNTVQSTGDYSKLTQGIHENYLQMKIKDNRMDSINIANEWLCFSDIANQKILSSQVYSYMKYLPFTMVTFHMLFAANQVPKIQYPQASYEAYTKKTKCENLMTSLMSDMSVNLRNYVNTPMLIMEIIPFLLEIISPSLRPVNMQLYSAREKAELMQVVKIMISYNVTYRQDRQTEGNYAYVLEPKIDDVIQFPNFKQRKTLTYATKQLISREIGIEKMRQAEVLAKQRLGAVNPTVGPVPNHKKILRPKNIPEKQKKGVSKDFFGRVVEKGTTVTTKKVDKDKMEDVLRKDIWFHFKEGYSNAVRKTLKLQDLW